MLTGCQYIHVTLHKALKQAVADGLIPRNATEAVRPPQVRKEEIQPLTAEQVKILFEAGRGDRLESLYILAVLTGLRQGEFLGLIFASETGEPLKRHNLTRRSFKPLLKRAGLPQIQLSRPEAYVRHSTALQERQSKGSVRDARARHHSYHPRHLLARATQHAERGCSSNVGHPYLERSGVKVVSKVPGGIEPGTFHAALIFCILQHLYHQ
jgi:integrase